MHILYMHGYYLLTLFKFTFFIYKIINNKKTPVVFILWGSYARNKKSLITNPIHYVIESPHPSPFSAYSGFFGSKPFSKTNDFLLKNKLTPIVADHILL